MASICAVSLSLAAGCSEAETDSEAPTTTASEQAQDCSTDLRACAESSSLRDLIPDTATEATGEPIEIGMINQENTPVGSFPELSGAANAAIEFINTDLGGIDGRPLALSVCNTNFSAEGSTSCGQRFVESGVPAVLGGIDVFGNGIDVLRDNAVPFVGGIPVSTQSSVNDNSFQFSGGSWGATVAFADHAVRETKAKKVSILYGEFGSISQAAEYGRTVLEDNGVQVQMVPYPIIAADLSGPLQAAIATEPDALFLLGADTACRPLLEGARNAGTSAAIYSVGSCAAPNITGQLAPEVVDGVIFNVEGPLSTGTDNPDALLYSSVVNTYGNGLDPVGAGTVSFKSMMNLYRVLSGIGADKLTPAGITEALAASVDTVSFLGHDYTCDGEQFEGLPSICSPQQILVQMTDGALTQISDWIEVGEIFQG